MTKFNDSWYLRPDAKTSEQALVQPYPNPTAYRQGWSAFQEGVWGIPGSFTEDFYKEWLRGWNAAYLKAYIRQRGVEKSLNRS